MNSAPCWLEIAIVVNLKCPLVVGLRFTRRNVSALTASLRAKNSLCIHVDLIKHISSLEKKLVQQADQNKCVHKHSCFKVGNKI